MIAITQSAARQTIEPPPLCDLDPNRLSAAQRRALTLMSLQRLYRRPGNRYGRPPNSLGVDIVNSLVTIGLARIERQRGTAPYPCITGAGRAVLDVMAQRRRP